MYRSPSRFDLAEAKRRDTEIRFWSSDSIALAKPTGMDRMCADGWCVFYRMHCDTAAVVCRYLITGSFREDAAPERVDVHEGFAIHAPTAEALLHLKNTVRFLLGGRSGPQASLARFDRDGGPITDMAEYVPCVDTAWVSGCPQPH